MEPQVSHLVHYQRRRVSWEQWGSQYYPSFTDHQLYLQENEGYEHVRHGQDFTPDIPNMINYRDCIFVICPKLSTEFHKEHKNSILYYKKLNKTDDDKMTVKQGQLKK